MKKQDTYREIGPIAAGVVMVTVLFASSFFLAGWASCLLLFFLLAVAEFMSRSVFNNGFLCLLFPFVTTPKPEEKSAGTKSDQDEV